MYVPFKSKGVPLRQGVLKVYRCMLHHIWGLRARIILITSTELFHFTEFAHEIVTKIQVHCTLRRVSAWVGPEAGGCAQDKRDVPRTRQMCLGQDRCA